MLRRSIIVLTILATVSLSVLASDDKTNPKDDPDAIGKSQCRPRHQFLLAGKGDRSGQTTGSGSGAPGQNRR
jgi:hypothetical protein